MLEEVYAAATSTWAAELDGPTIEVVASVVVLTRRWVE